jgi:hypothetical protein
MAFIMLLVLELLLFSDRKHPPYRCAMSDRKHLPYRCAISDRKHPPYRYAMPDYPLG